MSLEVVGKLTKLLPIETGEKKDKSGTWKKQLFLLQTEEEYNNLYCFEVFGDDKVDKLSKFKEGEDIKVGFNVSTNEWKGRYFTSLSAWWIEKLVGEKTPSKAPMTKESLEDFNDPNDPLPF